MTKKGGRWEERREKRRRREFKFREGEELARRIREATNHGTGGVGCWKEGFAGRCRKRVAGVRGTEGERGELGGAAITGMVVGEGHRWRQETGRPEGGQGGEEEEEGKRRERGACGRLQTRGATCFMTSVHHIAPVS